MKKLTVKKIVTMGKIEIGFYLDGEKIKTPYITSRELTGTTEEAYQGVFNDRYFETYSYGNRSKVFGGVKLTSALSPQEYVAEILDRIKKVRAWVSEMKTLDLIESGEASGMIEPTTAELIAEIETLKAEKVKRDKKGRFTK